MELDVREDGRAGLEADDRAALVRRADGGQRRLRLAQPVLLLMQLAVAVDRQEQVLGQGVDDRDADAVQTAGDLVGRVIELTAGVRTVMMTSAAERPSSGWISTGIPRPSSATVTDSSAWIVTVTCEQ